MTMPLVSLFFDACKIGDAAYIKLFVLSGKIHRGNINYLHETSYKTGLCIASENGHYDIVEQILYIPGIDVSLCDIYKTSPLIYACYKGHFEVANILVNHITQFAEETCLSILNYQDSCGRTALLDASRQGHSEIVDILLSVPGIGILLPDMYQDLPLNCACKNGHIKTGKLLLNYIATLPKEIRLLILNHQDCNGRTALRVATLKNHCDIVQLLLNEPEINVSLSDKCKAVEMFSNNAGRKVVEMLSNNMYMYVYCAPKML